MTDQAKIAIITGGSRGIGRNTALSLAARGVDTIITYNADKAAADEVVDSVIKAGRKGAALQLDVGKANAFDGFVEHLRSALRDFGSERFDFLVNNAGTSSAMGFQNATEAELDSLFAVHFKGVFLLSQKLLPLIADGGRIVNVSSMLAQHPVPGRAAYGSIKAAVEALTKYMAMELGPRRITVNVVAPGAVATDFSGGMVRDNPEVNKMVASHTALRRAGLPEDIGPMIASLLSEDGRWVNGARIEVSGGMGL